MATAPKHTRRKVTRELYAMIDDFIDNQGNKTFNYKQVSHAIGADTPQAQKAVAMRLAEMEFDGELIEVTPGKYKAPNRSIHPTQQRQEHRDSRR